MAQPRQGQPAAVGELSSGRCSRRCPQAWRTASSPAHPIGGCGTVARASTARSPRSRRTWRRCVRPSPRSAGSWPTTAPAGSTCAFDLDPIREPYTGDRPISRRSRAGGNKPNSITAGRPPPGKHGMTGKDAAGPRHGAATRPTGERHAACHSDGRNPGVVWSILTRPLRACSVSCGTRTAGSTPSWSASLSSRSAVQPTPLRYRMVHIRGSSDPSQPALHGSSGLEQAAQAGRTSGRQRHHPGARHQASEAVVHEPLIDTETFKKAQALLSASGRPANRRKPRSMPRSYVLRHLLHTRWMLLKEYGKQWEKATLGQVMAELMNPSRAIHLAAAYQIRELAGTRGPDNKDGRT
ncbi:hypothetical protein Nocox_41315 [Nonomuraea coxensis DSM 45129]|uniref:Uncharacterized protein n=1 Tax=Nonomuraea coxensis DSM 45129 TaxID=1122611 RepID=A0ABX8UH53_9ACTN|nr:hypothetical protein Nocox_41315 [Nonomuraea coxensis DSM 45129]